ncbi:rRNA maturation RNase YbeY [Fulvivirgaceae bacterium BMA10]|uniref:Endoribonuclease YbeY n=1 Tax=Splendidivirga corallicola TaxID=3051826 RepID=A0ABT8KMU4_9BACT|nr:rRNA maturation RNase YbeY [Fulvivirgaceae bacterium BMA10]
MNNINFFSEDIVFEVEFPTKLQNWILKIIEIENSTAGNINFIFCSDTYLHDINLTYLNHDTYTDIITFDNSETDREIEGDIFISIDRIKENASTFDKAFNHELKRVMAHGILHLLGYDDKNEALKLQMRKKEEACLSLY